MRAGLGTIDVETVGDARITGIETGNTTDNAIRVSARRGEFSTTAIRGPISSRGPGGKLTISGVLGIDDPIESM